MDFDKVSAIESRGFVFAATISYVLNKPFIMLLPTPKLHTSYFRELFADDNDPIQIIIPRKRIHFIKKDGKKLTQTNKCNFDCLYYCWKINLPRDIIWLR